MESYLDDLMEYLYPKMDKILQAKGGGSYFGGVHVTYKHARPVCDEDENKRDDDDDDENSPVYLH